MSFADHVVNVSAITLMVGAFFVILSAYVAPALTYFRSTDLRDPSEKSTSGLRVPDDDAEVLTVELHNEGIGPALIRRVCYDIRTAAGEHITTSSIRDFVAFLRDTCDAEDGVDFDVVGISSRWALGPQSSKTIAVLPMPLARRLSLFRVTVTYRGVVGWRRLHKAIDLVPVDPTHRALPPPRPAPAAAA